MKRQLVYRDHRKTLHCAGQSPVTRHQMRCTILLRGTVSVWRSQLSSWRHFARPARFSAFAREPAHTWKTVQCREAVGVSQHSTARLQHSSVQASHPATDALPSAPQVCSGCGIGLQAQNPNAPGYFKVPSKKRPRQETTTVVEQEDALSQTQDNAPQLDRLSRQQVLTPSTSGSDEEDEPSVLCARCYSLRHYGRIISQQGESALPEFDLNKKVGRKLQLQKYRRAVVLCVIDLEDFDGSLPREALQELLPSLAKDASISTAGYRLVIAANKVDLFPPQATQSRLKDWVYRRCKQAGLPPPAAVHLVSSVKGSGVRDLMTDLQDKVGTRGDVWVVGAQNAGKSSLINAMQKASGVKANKQITTAALPGTTLGMLRVEGVFPSACRLWDTPGVKHHYQLSSKLNPDEVRMLLPRRQLKPRTYRAAADQTILVGGLARVDVVKLPAQSLYLTVWASDEVSCHYGRTDKASERQDNCCGSVLVPPLGGAARMAELGALVPQDVLLEGASWKESSVDIAIAGLGWIAVGVKGPADLRVWVHEGVSITTHASILPDYARDLERPGFSQSNIKVAAKQTSV